MNYFLKYIFIPTALLEKSKLKNIKLNLELVANMSKIGSLNCTCCFSIQDEMTLATTSEKIVQVSHANMLLSN